MSKPSITRKVTANKPVTRPSSWPPRRSLVVTPANHSKVYDELSTNSARFYDFSYTTYTDRIVFDFRATEEDYVFLKLAYSL